MKQSNIVLLNLNPANDLAGRLRGILESTPDPGIRLQQESIGTEQSAHLADQVPELVARANPAVIFLVSTWNYLKQAKSLLPSLRRERAQSPIVVVSDADAPDEMFEMIKLGANDFITPPLTPTGILPRLWRLLEQTVRGDLLRDHPRENFFGTKMLLGESPAILEIVKKIPQIALFDTTVLISGETGTGKEVCARSIHQLSQRASREFVAINCGSIPI